MQTSANKALQDVNTGVKTWKAALNVIAKRASGSQKMANTVMKSMNAGGCHD
jgi:hypothetical protein